MPKRSFPFYNSSAQVMKTHITPLHVEKDVYMEKVYAKTKDLLLKGAEEAQKNDLSMNSGPQMDFKCQLCSHLRKNVAVVCSFCDKRVCSSCCGFCSECGGEFCSNCSVVTYGDMEETYCLGCLKS